MYPPLKHAVLVIGFIVLSSLLCLGQGFSVGTNSPPAVNVADSFTTSDGRFSISLPSDFHGFQPVSADSPTGKVTGDSYDWKMKEASFTAGYIDRPEILDENDTAKRTLNFMRDSLVERAKPRGGTFAGARSLSGLGHPAVELRIDFPDGLFIQRIYLVAKRMYLVSAVLHKDQLSNEPAAVKILDSFRILSDTDIAVALKKKIDEATPEPLPQGPDSRPKSDAVDERLMGRVKTVFTESQGLSGTWAALGRQPSAKSYYNEQGNLTRTELYDWKGNLSDITVYGYIEGDRVSKSSHIRHEYDPPPMMAPATATPAKVTRDPRYSIKYKYTYDNGRLKERLVIGNDGEARTRCVHEFKNDQEEESCYSPDGKLYYKSVSILNARGNEIERTTFRPKRATGADTKDAFDSEKYSYSYEFDASGNWIKQTTSKWTMKDGRGHYEPSSVDYRAISYYK